jgi:glycosyltransferase involved in cell wall biosynthesis
MIKSICLDENFSTTKLVIQEKPEIVYSSQNKFKNVLFLPENKERQDEGGLRTKNYFKKSFKDKPLISIITVVYNHDKYLERTIKSVLNQSYDNIEFIIIDGGSTDNTLNTIRKYKDMLDYFVSEKDIGIYDAMNKAIKLIQGIYYVVLGADDYLYPNAIFEIVTKDINSNSNIDFIVGSVDVGKTTLSGYYPEKSWLGASAVVTTHSVGMVIKSQLHHELGLYNLKFPQIADSLFIKNLLLKKKEGLPSETVMGRFSLNGVSNNNVARGLCEGFLIQLETEKSVLLQVTIFILRILKNFSRLKNIY